MVLVDDRSCRCLKISRRPYLDIILLTGCPLMPSTYLIYQIFLKYWRFNLAPKKEDVKVFVNRCVRKVKMSPLTAKVKCPHGRGEDTNESEAVTEVACNGFGGGGQDHLEGGRREDRCLLPAGQTNSKSRQAERGQGCDSRQCGSSASKPDLRDIASADVGVVSGKIQRGQRYPFCGEVSGAGGDRGESGDGEEVTWSCWKDKEHREKSRLYK